MAPFQKMRRRLTVTGASETIDGVSKLSVSDNNSNNNGPDKVTNDTILHDILNLKTNLLCALSRWIITFKC